MRFASIMIVLAFLVTLSCENAAESTLSNTSKQSVDSKLTSEAFQSTITSEAIVLGKHEDNKVRQLLITEDLNHPKLKADLKKITTLSTEDILLADQYDLAWLDVKKIDNNDLTHLKIGSKIRFDTLNGQLETHPPTLIAEEVEVMD